MNDRMAATNRIWNILAVLSPVLMGFGASTGWSQGYTEVVSMTWNFSTAANPLGWYPIVSLSNFGISNGSLGYTATSSIYTIYSPPISVPTTALQRVEIVMSSNTSGAAKVFWAPAQTGVYNGFQPGDENDFTMIGDGVPHTYFLPINTSSASTIYGLRLDVPPSAAVSIQSVVLSNLQAPIGAGVSPLWQFNTNGNMQGWVIYSGTLDTSVAGGTLNLKTYSNATILAPQAQVTNQLEWFSLMGSVTQTSLETPWLQFNFVSTANNGAPTSSYVPLVPDSAEHVYNQNVGGASGWYSMVSQLSLTLSENTTFAISQIQISTAPQGSADLTVDAFGPATSLIRVGSPFQISCRASDRGNQPVQGLSASLNLPSDGSVQVLSSPSVPSSISNGYPQTLVWTLTSSKAGEVPISVSATSQSGGSAQVSKTFLVNPAVAPQSFPYVPPPIPALSNYDVGIYYFPGWSLNSHWDPIRYFPERTPVLGYYAEGNSQVIDWQIKWAAEHGVKFFAVDWYWYGPSMPSTEQGEQPNNFLNAYFSSAYQNFMKFCLAYAGNQSAVIAGSTSEFLSIAQTWITKYFSQPEYYTINGTPVVFVINPDILDANLGGSANSALAAARQLAKSAGFKGIYFIAATYPGQASQYAADGYDALSAYNYSSAGTSDPDESPYSEMVSGYPSVWDSLAGSTDIPYIIPTSPGWDLRPWATFDAPNELVRTGSTPELFQQMLQAAKTSIDSGAGPKVMLVEAWNELIWGDSRQAAFRVV